MESNIENLLDSTLDDLADLPAFRPFVPGAHRVALSLEVKEVSSKLCVEAKFKLLETLEQSDPTEAPMEPGTEGNILLQLNNPFGQGKLKEILKVIAGHFGPATNKKLIEQTKNLEVLAVTKIRKSKTTDAEYTELVSIQII